MIPFVKMHGCGNDFVVVRDADLAVLELGDAAFLRFTRLVCDRHFGVGADGLLAYGSGDSASTLRMRYWNSDGSRAEMCGNGARCVVRLAVERGEATSPLLLTTDHGALEACVLEADDSVAVEICMGRVRWEPEAIGMRGADALVDAPLRVGERNWNVTAVSIGNPHAIVFLDTRAELANLQLETIGTALSTHPHFERGANASFVVVDAGDIHVRVWERGAGATLACGTASCAVVAAAARLGRLQAPEARVHLPGGTVEVRLDASQRAWLRGPAAYVAEGKLDASLLRDAGV